jgi:hypothetical protein
MQGVQAQGHTHGVHAVPVAVTHHVGHAVHVVHAKAHAVIEARLVGEPEAHWASHTIVYHHRVISHGTIWSICVGLLVCRSIGRGWFCALSPVL